MWDFIKNYYVGGTVGPTGNENFIICMFSNSCVPKCHSNEYSL